jgi:uncharacterized protein
MAYSLPVLNEGQGSTPRISSLLIKPASAICNLDCAYCFYVDREADPYKSLPARRMTQDTLAHLVDTYLFYSYPNSAFAFQGGEPTLSGIDFFESLVELQKRYGRNGQTVSNAMQTNGVLLNDRWCKLFKEYDWLIGVSIDGPEPVHDLYRLNKQGAGSWRRVMNGVECLKKHGVEFNALCVVSQANVAKAAEIYKFFRSLDIDYLQYIPLSEFDDLGQPSPFTITPEQYGRFLCEMFDLWWPDRRKARIRYFDNIAEALAGQKPSTCTMHETCDSYVVVEYNGDVYPCDFFVAGEWRLGNINIDSWTEIARQQRRYRFAATKTIPRPECQVCEYQSICHGGCPKHRHDPRGKFGDLDYFCLAYRMIFAKAVEPLRKDIQRITNRPESLVRR